MNAIDSESREADWDRYDEELGGELPGRPRRQFFNKWTALLFAVIVGAGCFYGGIRVEKNQLASSSSGSTVASTFASRFGAAAGGTGTTAGGTSTTAGSSTSSTSSGASGAGRFGGGGFASLFGGGGGSATVGTVSSVDGHTIYVDETSGNTVKVTLSKVTTITKSEPVSKAKVYPGDTVVISGVSGKNGTVAAASVTDSGTRSTGSSTTSSSSSGSGLSSLF